MSLPFQRTLGHSASSTTLNTYSHLWPSAEDRTRAAAGVMSAASAELSPEGRARAPAAES